MDGDDGTIGMSSVGHGHCCRLDIARRFLSPFDGGVFVSVIHWLANVIFDIFWPKIQIKTGFNLNTQLGTTDRITIFKAFTIQGFLMAALAVIPDAERYLGERRDAWHRRFRNRRKGTVIPALRGRTNCGRFPDGIVF